jgi:aminopeptidase N
MTPRCGVPVLLALWLALPLAAQNRAVDVLHYRIELEIPASVDAIDGTAELTVRPLTPALATLALDFAGLTVDGVTIDDHAATFTRDGAKLSIALPRPASVPFRARIRYHGKPEDGLFLQRNKYGDAGVFADNWPNRAHYWFPSVDHPSDKASVEFIVTAPERFDVIANGTRVETTSLQNGFKRTHWSEATPIPVHCMVFGAAEFSVLRAGAFAGTEITYYLYPHDRELGARGLGRTSQMVNIFTDLIGPYPYDKLALVESSTRFGGMENATAIFLNEKRVGEKASMEAVVAHEIAHQWFGDALSQSDWHDLWLSEGFATYFGTVFFERADGAGTFRRVMRERFDEYLQSQGEDARPVFDPAITDLPSLLNKRNYNKGAWVLHMLRGVMGDGAFFDGIRDYYAAYRNGNVSTVDFRVVMERHAGQPLDWFFREWIFEPGHPVYTLAWTWDEKRSKVAVTIEQRQTTPTTFRMPLTLEMRGDGFRSRETVTVDSRSEQFELDSAQRPDEVVVDPDEMVMKEIVR